MAPIPQGVGAPQPSGPKQERPDPSGRQRRGGHVSLRPDPPPPEGVRPRGTGLYRWAGTQRSQIARIG
uniref:Uncharacterized protein n=1 Tax=Oryza sativa subsp. japonica TaxID=39947 RepID=Q6K657_ORYSJ|nr:hypothetical protein [Oryza sativa Japonica Group]